MDGRKAILRRAEPGELDAVYGLILERVAWMDRVGLRQWNNIGYLEAYPRAYFGEQLEAGRLYVLKEGGGTVKSYAQNQQRHLVTYEVG